MDPPVEARPSSPNLQDLEQSGGANVDETEPSATSIINLATNTRPPPQKYGIFANDFDPDKYPIQRHMKLSVPKRHASYVWPLRHGLFALPPAAGTSHRFAAVPAGWRKMKTRSTKTPPNDRSKINGSLPGPELVTSQESKGRSPSNSSTCNKPSASDKNEDPKSNSEKTVDQSDPGCITHAVTGAPEAVPKSRLLKSNPGHSVTARRLLSTLQAKKSQGRRNSRSVKKAHSIFDSQGSHSSMDSDFSSRRRNQPSVKAPCKRTHKKPQVAPLTKIQLRSISKKPSYDHLMKSLEHLRPKKRQCT